MSRADGINKVWDENGKKNKDPLRRHRKQFFLREEKLRRSARRSTASSRTTQTWMGREITLREPRENHS